MTTARKIGIFGSGNAGQTLGRAWKAAGHDVMIGSRNPASVSLEGLDVGTLHEVARFGDILVNSTPGDVTLDTLQAVPAEDMVGKALLDMAVGLQPDYGSLKYNVESGAEVLQAAFPDVKVVKTLCTMTSVVMVNPAILGEPTTVFLSGDDADAKAQVSQLLTDPGWAEDAKVDLGGIKSARGQEHFAMMYFAAAEAFGHDVFNIRLVVKP